MKKHLLLFLAVILSISAIAADLNPFAYNLYTSTNTDGGTRLHFSINAFAPTVEVYIIVGEVEKKIRTYSNVAKNNYSTDLTASDAASAGLTEDSSYSWKVKVTTPDRSSAAEYVGRKVSDKPIFSIDIDNNPASPYFSRILATHGTDNIANAQGIYAYNAAFEADGGRNMGTGIATYSGWWSGNHLTPYRIRIAQDGSGRIFLGNFDVSHTGAYLWQVDPANLKSWTQLIARSWMKSHVGTNVDDLANQIDVYNMGLDIRTNGNKYELLLLSANTGGANFTTGSVFSGVYTIPDITNPTASCTYKQLKWTKVTGEQSVRNLFGSAINGSAIYDKHGGVWYCGNSSSGTQPTYPGLAHQFANATDYKIDYDNSDAHFQKQYTSAGGMRYDRTYSRMVVAQGARTDIVGCIYTVTQASAGTRPTLGSRVDLNAGAAKGSTGWYATDFAWDYADNIYACVRNTSADVRGVYAFATDLGGKVLEVAARSNFTLQLPSGVKEGTKGLNPYAYDVRATYDEATHKLTVNFSLNDDAYNDGTGGNADGIQIYLSDDPANPKKWYVDGVPANMCFKGENKTRNIDLSTGKDLRGTDLPRNTDLYVSVTVQGDRTNTSPRQVSTSYKIYCGHGVAVDKNPKSKNFGKIFITEAKQGNTQNNTYPETKGLPGMYVLDPNFEFTNTTRYTGGYSFAKESITKGGYEPWRIRVSQEGRIFACSNDADNSVAIWEIDKNNFNTWTPVLSGTRNDQHTFTYNGYAIGPIIGMDVKGVGNNLTLLLYTTDKDGTNYNDSHYFAYEYNVSTKAISPVSAFNGVRDFAIVHDLVSMVYGVDGSYWFGASRGTGTERNLAHVKLDKSTVDYDNYNTEFKGGGGLINYKSTYDNATINGANHSWLIKGKNNGSSTNGYFEVLLVSMTSGGGASVTRMDGNGGRPNWQKIEVTGMITWLNDFAIDYAENLYVVGSDGKLLRAFAMPYCGEKTTPALNQTANAQYSFQLKGQAITWHPYHCPETMINEDLWELFMEDYNEWYYTNKHILPEPRAIQPITNAIGFTFPPEEIRGTYPNGAVLDFLQNHPQWKWLHDYINSIVLAEGNGPTSNEALWSEFKTAANITGLGKLSEIKAAGAGKPHNNGDNPCACRIICAKLTAAAVQAVFGKAEWKWLQTYIMNVQSDLTDDLTTAAWRYAIAAFFLQSQHSDWPASADFSTAGLPSAWNPAAEAAGQTYVFSMTGEMYWRLHIHAFFNKTNSVTYKTNDGGTKTDATADFSEAGDPHAWYNTWAEVTFPKTMRTGDKMPKIKRKGYIFAGWHYGTEQGFTRDQKVAGDQYNEGVTDNKHIWARWQEVCFYEGYVKHPDEHDFDIKDRKNLNYNEELVGLAEGKSIQIDVERKLQSGMYNTMMLPFAIPEKDYLLKVTDMDGTHIFDRDKGGAMPSILVYEGFETINVGGEDMLQIKFHELRDHDESILAYRPFFIQPTNGNITSRMHFWSAYISGAMAIPQVGEGVSFVPHFVPKKVTVPEGASALILVAENRLAHLVGDDEMLGLRGYFLVPEALSNQPAQICVKTNSETGIKDIFVPDEAEASAYKILQNQRVLIIRENKIYDIMGNLLYEL